MLKKSIVVIQSICISWTKKARGGVLATARNKVPRVFQIPLLPDTHIAQQSYILHHLLWSETNDFTKPVRDQVDVNVIQGPIKQQCIGIYPTDHTLKIGFEGPYLLESEQKIFFEYRCLGAPMRTVPLVIFELAKEEWGQIQYNGRHSPGYQSTWTYEKWIFNIGFFSEFSGAKFIENPPQHNYSSLMELH